MDKSTRGYCAACGLPWIGFGDIQSFPMHSMCECGGYINWDHEGRKAEDRKPAHAAVAHPSHYTAFPVEVIEIIKAALGPDGFTAYCFGNEIKYRMRAGLKGDNAQEDIAKALTYKSFRESCE